MFPVHILNSDFPKPSYFLPTFPDDRFPVFGFSDTSMNFPADVFRIDQVNVPVCSAMSHWQISSLPATQADEIA